MSLAHQKKRKRNAHPARWSEHARNKAREQKERIALEKLEREKALARRIAESNAAADAVLAYRAEKAKRIEDGKPVLKSYEEWRELQPRIKEA